MIEEYDGLEDLMRHCAEADSFFNALPEYVRESILSRADDICSIDDLEDYADSLMTGD